MLTIHQAIQLLPLDAKAVAVLLYGDSVVRTLAMNLTAASILKGGTVLWVEAANQFDLYAFTEAAKRWGEQPEPFLRQLHIARTFTIYQLGALCTEGVAEALRQHPGALTIISDPLALCWDAEVPWTEARRLVRQIAAGLARLRANGHRIVITSPDPPDAFRERACLVAVLQSIATRTMTVRSVESGLLLSDGVSVPRHRLAPRS